MLKNRQQTSSKYYKTIPCVLAKSLVSRYQRNKKLKAIHSLVLPICGDKGRQVKLVEGGVRVPALFGKEVLPCTFPKPIVGTVREVIFHRRSGTWYMSYSYNVPVRTTKVTGFVGIDRNARGNVATLSDLESGKVLKLGPDVKPWKDNLKRRKAKLQRKGAKRLLKKLNRKQSNRTRDINHKVSKQVVDYAVNHRKSIVLENLGKIKNSRKCGRFVQKSNWSFFQLETFIKYKASLCGIPVLYVNPKNTSRGCSKCGSINEVSGKAFKCKNCGHKDHRDANAGFNIATKGKHLVGITGNERELPARHIGIPLNLEELNVQRI